MWSGFTQTSRHPCPTLGLAARAFALTLSQGQATGAAEVMVGPQAGNPERGGLSSLPHTLPLSSWISLSLPGAKVSSIHGAVTETKWE